VLFNCFCDLRSDYGHLSQLMLAF